MKSLRLLFATCLLGTLAPLASAVTMIFPADAIDDLWTLPADEFKQKYAGINVTGLGPSDEGWYVRYRHENLTYLFGPLAEREDARKRKWDMETVRDAAIRNRASLASSQVDFVRFTFSGVFGRRGEGGGGGTGDLKRVSTDGRSGPDGDLDGDGIPNAQDEDMDGDGIPNGQDPDADGDGVPNGQDDYSFGSDPNGAAGDGRTGPEGDLDGDGVPNGRDGDMDGDGIPNDQDPDVDGDGVPNAQDDYPYGAGPPGSGAGGAGTVAGREGQPGSRSGGQGQGQGQEAGQGGESGSGQEAGAAGSQGQRQVAGMQQRGNRSGQQGGQSGQQAGQSGQQGGQQGQQGQQSNSAGGSSGSGQGSPGQPGMPSNGGSSGNPLDVVVGLLRAILGI